jgi:hypothetical protein
MEQTADAAKELFGHQRGTNVVAGGSATGIKKE